MLDRGIRFGIKRFGFKILGDYNGEANGKDLENQMSSRVTEWLIGI